MSHFINLFEQVVLECMNVLLIWTDLDEKMEVELKSIL
jgi:hypothetical protein